MSEVVKSGSPSPALMVKCSTAAEGRTCSLGYHPLQAVAEAAPSFSAHPSLDSRYCIEVNAAEKNAKL